MEKGDVEMGILFLPVIVLVHGNELCTGRRRDGIPENRKWETAFFFFPPIGLEVLSLVFRAVLGQKVQR